MSDYTTDRLGRITRLRRSGIVGATVTGASTDTGWYRLLPDGVTATRPGTNQLNLQNIRSDVDGIDLTGWRVVLANPGFVQDAIIIAMDGGVITTYDDFATVSRDGMLLGVDNIRYILTPQLLNSLNITFDSAGEGKMRIGYTPELIVPGAPGFSREEVTGDTRTPTIIDYLDLSPGQSVSIPVSDARNLFYQWTTASDANLFYWGEHSIRSQSTGGGGGRGAGSSGDGNTVVVSGDYVATLNAADGTPGAQVKLTHADGSAMWQLVGADRQHVRVQAVASLSGTDNSDLQVQIPASVASGEAGNDWSLALQAGADPQPAEQAYVDLFGSATQYLRVQLGSGVALGAAGNDWKIIIVRSTGATTAAASIDTTDEELTITITSTATLAAVKTAIDNGITGVGATLVGTNPGAAVVGARTTAQIAGSQTHDTTANTIDFHSGADATTRESVQFSVDATAMTATLSGIYNDTLMTALVTAINAVWRNEAVASGSGTVASTTSTTAFTGGLDIEPLSATVNETAMTVTLNYQADTDTLTDIVAVIAAQTDVEARLYGGVDGTGFAQDPPFDINFVPEAILSEPDILALIAASPAVVSIEQVDAETLRVTLRDGTTADLAVGSGGGSGNLLALSNVPATDPTADDTLLFLTANVTTFTAGKTVRNEDDTADLTAGGTGDLYQWDLTNTKWVRLFPGNSGVGLSQSAVEALIQPVQTQVDALIPLYKQYTADDTTLTGNGTVDITFDITDILDYITVSDNTRARFDVEFQDSRHPASGRVLDASLIDSGFTIGTLDTDTLASPGNSAGRFHQIVGDVSNLQNNTLTLRIVIADSGPAVVHTFDSIELDAYLSYTSGQSIDFVTSIPADSTGADGDIAINTDTGQFYMKESGSWFSEIDLATQQELRDLILVSNNFPTTDPADGTYLFFSSAQTSFTTGKTVRNRVNNADVTSAGQGDLFKFSASNSRWLRQYQVPAGSSVSLPQWLQDGDELPDSQIPSQLRVIDFRLAPSFFDPDNILSEYQAHAISIGGSFSESTHARLRIADIVSTTPVTRSAHDVSPVLTLSVDQQLQIRDYLEANDSIELFLEYGGLLGQIFAVEHSQTFSIPRVYATRDLVTEDDYQRRQKSNPPRGTELPARMYQWDFYVLTEDSYTSNKIYTFDGSTARTTNSNAPPANWQYAGINTLTANAEYPAFGNSGAPTIFRTDRVAGLYQVNHGRIKIVLPDALLTLSSLASADTLLNIRIPGYVPESYVLRTSTFEDTGLASRTVGGTTYNIYEINATSGFEDLFRIAIDNSEPISFQLSEVVSGERRYLSDDNTDTWEAGTTATAGLWTGNSSGVPVGPLDIDRLLSAATSGSGGPGVLSGDNFPTTDPADGTHFVFNQRRAVFTTGKTVRNEDNTADVTSASAGDLFEWVAATSRWIRQYDFSVLVQAVVSSDAIFASRAEQVFFQALTNVGTTDVDAPLRSASPVVVRFGDGTPELVSTVSGNTNAIRILTRGIYSVHLEGQGTALGSGSNRRVLPRIRFYQGDSNTLAGEVDDHYHRTDGTNASIHLSGDGTIYIPNDDTDLEVAVANEIVSGGVSFNVAADWSLTFSPQGVKGDAGEQGFQGRFEIPIYQNVAANAVPSVAPTGGTFTYSTALVTDVPSGWSLTPTTPTNTQRTVRATTTIDYAAASGDTLAVVWTVPIPITGAPGANGRDGTDGQDGAPGRDGSDGSDGADGQPGTPGADGRDGSDGEDGAQGRFDLPIYRNVAGNSIPTDAPSGGTYTWASGAVTDVPTGWSLTQTTPTGDQRTVRSVATIDPAAASGLTLSLTWSAPIPITGATGPSGTDGRDGSDGTPGAAGRDGTDGSDGSDGATGPQGRFDIAIYQNAADGSLPTTAPTGGTYTYSTRALTDIPSGWSLGITAPTGTQRTVKAVTTIDPASASGATLAVTWSVPIPVTGSRGAAGADGSDGRDGSDGADGTDGTTLTGAQIVALLEALGSGARLSWNFLDDRPSIPTDTTVFYGPYVGSTLIPANRIVTFDNRIFWTTAEIPASNTDDPDSNSSFQQLDIGSPNDLIGVLLSGSTTLRFTQRSGSTIDVALPTGGPPVYVQPNFPATDPTVDGALLWLSEDQSSFTSGKTIRNEADDGDLTTGIEGDLFKWNLAGTKWVLQLKGAGIYESAELEEADVEGGLVATSAALPTAAQATPFTSAWTITSLLTGVTDNSGVLQGLPRTRPSTSVFGWSVSAWEGDTKTSETYFNFGAASPDPDSPVQSYSAKPLSFDNGEVIMVEYYHDDDNGDSFLLSGAGKVLPANATVQVRLAVSGHVQATSTSGQTSSPAGVAFIGPNLIQITQWIRSSSAPSDPGTVTYDSSAGTFAGLAQNGWSQTRPTAGSDPYWTATVSLSRGTDGTWSSGTDWVITAADSSLIQFRNYVTNAWEAAPSDTNSMMRIWTNGVWREIPLSSNNLLFETDPNDNELLTLASPVSVADIEYLRLDLEQGGTRITTRISMDMLAGVNRDQLQEYQGAMEATRSDLNRTMVVLLDRWGFGGSMVVGTQNITQRDYSQAGGAYFNFFVNATNQITHCRVISTFGIINYLRNSLDSVLRIVAET